MPACPQTPPCGGGFRGDSLPLRVFFGEAWLWGVRSPAGSPQGQECLFLLEGVGGGDLGCVTERKEPWGGDAPGVGVRRDCVTRTLA